MHMPAHEPIVASRGRGDLPHPDPRPDLPRGRGPSPAPRPLAGAGLRPALGQDGGLPRGLRLLPAGGALSHGRRGAASDGRRRRPGRRPARPGTTARPGSAWAPPGARSATTRQFDRVLEMVRGVKALGAGGLLHPRHAHRRPGAAPEGGRARRLQPQPRLLRGVLRPDHLDADLRGSTADPASTSARRASRSAAAGSSAWARPRTTGSACCTRWRPCPSPPSRSRSTPWWPSRGRRSADRPRGRDLGHGPHDRDGPDLDAHGRWSGSPPAGST